MTERILDFSDRPAYLSVRDQLLVIDFHCSASGPSLSSGQAPAGVSTGAPVSPPGGSRDPESGLRARAPAAQTVPLADIAVLVVSYPQVTYTHAVLAGLAEAGGMFIACNPKRAPCGMLLPLSAHSTQTERFRAQASLPVPHRKRLWRQIVIAKIAAQARLLRERTGQDWGLEAIRTKVRSGDPQNLEARAARLYWKALFGKDSPDGAGEAFRRDPQGEWPNPALNYGYAVLRAIVARALCAAGLHPSLGIHHHNRYDTFCLADDLMEPFRPVVDCAVAKLKDQRGPQPLLDKESKRVLLEALLGRFTAAGESRTLFDWTSRAASSLAAAIELGESQPASAAKIDIPTL